MKTKLLVLVLVLSVLLAGCRAGEASSQPAPAQSAPRSSPAQDKPQQPVLVDRPDSLYPMAVERWSVDMDGDGTEELVELRAEKGYFGNETEPEKWFEGDGMHPYTLVVTHGDTVYELPLGREDNSSPPLTPVYWTEERTGRGWTQDKDGRPVLVLWFDSLSRVLDIYALGFHEGAPVLLPVPEGEFETVPDQWSEWYD